MNLLPRDNQEASGRQISGSAAVGRGVAARGVRLEAAPEVGYGLRAYLPHRGPKPGPLCYPATVASASTGSSRKS